MRILCAALCVLLLNVGCSKENDHGEIINVDETDVEMNNAIQKARSTLNEFTRRFYNPQAEDSNFALKVMVEDEYGVEHFWVTNLTSQNETWNGILANEPKTVKSVAAGQSIVFEEEKISDWSYDHNGVRQGSYTLHVLLNRMPEEQADYYRQVVGWSK